MANWENNIRKVVPYTPGEQPNQPDMIKLNTNENPYPPAPGVREVLRNMDTDTLRLYPDPAALDLVRAIADTYGLSDNQVFVGVGSDDVLAMSFLTFFNSEKPILFPDITYSFYPVWAEVYRIPYECPPLQEDFTINVNDYKKKNGGVVITNPNAPTSIALGTSQVEEIIAANPEVVVIIDEAYVDFGGESVLPLIDKYDNLLVVRTYSKSRSMAGMRIGYAMGNPALIQAMKDVKESINSYTMNTESILIGAASLEDEEYFQENIKKVMNTRAKTKEGLEKLGFDVKESCTNFLFAGHKDVPAKEMFEKLREKGIFVRYFNKPRICDYLRITIGTREEMQTLFDFLKDYLTESSK